MNLLDSLKENNSIILHQKAKNWEEAINLALKPLVSSKAIEPKYIKAIIKSTKENGPYYIISDNVAMPHARPEDGVLKNAFSLITLVDPIKFENDEREIKVLVSLAATSAEIHTANALPQIVSIFENDATTTKIINAQTPEEVIKIIKNIDLNKYLS